VSRIKDIRKSVDIKHMYVGLDLHKATINATVMDENGTVLKEVREYIKLGYKKWSKKVKYGLRWAIEGIFSSIKRMFGEDLRARSVIGLLAKAMQKVWAYDAMVSYAKNAMLMA